MNATRVFLCADIGTSSLKAALVDDEGRLFAYERVAYEPAASALVWEAAFYSAARALADKAAGRAEIRAVAISGNGPSLVALDDADAELALLPWHEEGVADFKVSSASSLFLPHVARFKARSAELFEKTRRFLSSQEWLSFRLGAEAVTVLPTGAYEPYYWDAGQLARYGIAAESFPRFVLPGQRIGALCARAAEETGLKPGIPLVSGGPDFFMAILGSGVLEPGMVSDRAGSSEGVNLCATRRADEGSGFLVLPHWRAGLWTVDAIIGPSGRLFEQYRARTGQSGRSYADIMGELEAAFRDPRAASVRSLEGTRLLERLGFSVRRAVDRLRAAGFPLEDLRLSGGQAKSPIWNRLKADITGCRLEVPRVVDAELPGDAAACLVALGEAKGIEEAVGRTVAIDRVYEPDPATLSAYEERYREWLAS